MCFYLCRMEKGFNTYFILTNNINRNGCVSTLVHCKFYVFMYVCMYVCMYICACLSVCLSIYLSVWLSIYPPTYIACPVTPPQPFDPSETTQVSISVVVTNGENFIQTNNSNRNGCVRARPMSYSSLHLDVIFYNIAGSLFRILDKNK